MSTSAIERRNRSVALTLLGLAYLGYAGIAAGAAARSRSLPVVPCALRTVTGHRCPLCGMTGAMGATLRRNPVEARRHHRLGSLTLPLVAGTIAVQAVAAWRAQAELHRLDGDVNDPAPNGERRSLLAGARRAAAATEGLALVPS